MISMEAILMTAVVIYGIAVVIAGVIGIIKNSLGIPVFVGLFGLVVLVALMLVLKSCVIFKN